MWINELNESRDDLMLLSGHQEWASTFGQTIADLAEER